MMKSRLLRGAPGTPMHLGACLATALACAPARVPLVRLSAADELFTTYAAAAPPVQSRLFDRCWKIVGDALAATVPLAKLDAGAFDGALEAFVAPGPDDPDSVPDEQRALIAKLSDTAASCALRAGRNST